MVTYVHDRGRWTDGRHPRASYAFGFAEILFGVPKIVFVAWDDEALYNTGELTIPDEKGVR
jgi:hypothetical protein